MELIEKVIKNHKFPVVAFSGGKDSTVVLDLVRKINPDVLGVFCNTGVQAKSTYEYVRRVDNVEWLKPEKTFWQCVDEKGFPEMKGKSTNRMGYCCYHLKEKPMKKFIKKEDIDFIFTGLTMGESRQRMMFLKSWGNYGYVKSWKCFKCHPISVWDEDDVWNYIRGNGIDYNLGYDRGMVRSGCQPCTAYCSWKERMANENPKMLAFILQKRFNQMQLDIKLGEQHNEI